MPKLAKLIFSLSAGTGIYWTMAPSQHKQNIYGAYLSLVSSYRSALIVYQSYNDYQSSLSGIQYNNAEYHKVRHQVHIRVANRILKLSKQNRGIYLKLGQYLGNLQKIVPWEFVEVLKVLQDSAPSLPFEQMKVIFQTDLNKESSAIFSYIDQKPVAAASLAQVHRATLAQNNKQVAIKMQYPFLRIQSKWDLIMLKHLTMICNSLVKRWKNANIDFLKLYNEWTATLVEELDFSIEVKNAQKIKKLFEGNENIYIPDYYQDLCSDRLIVMEYVEGLKVNQRKQMLQRGINPKLVGTNLIDLFTTMIFKHGFVHCDAHPGNFLIRSKNNQIGHQIVLLDHGLYRSLRPQTINNFSGLFTSLLLQQKQHVHRYAKELKIHQHEEYLPFIFLHRSRNSRKQIGSLISEDQMQYIRDKDLANFDTVNQILQVLPPQLMYIIRTSNLISAHNINLGGSNRARMLTFAQKSLHILFPNQFTFRLKYIQLLLRVWLFETFPTVYKYLFGNLQKQ